MFQLWQIDIDDQTRPIECSWKPFSDKRHVALKPSSIHLQPNLCSVFLTGLVKCAIQGVRTSIITLPGTKISFLTETNYIAMMIKIVGERQLYETIL